MSENEQMFWSFIAIFSLLFFGLGFSLGKHSEKSAINHELIERGLMHYDSQTGELVWKEEE